MNYELRGKNKLQSGFTLVEMLVTAAIFALAFIAISAIFVGGTNSQSKSKATSVVLNESQFVFEQMARLIRENTIVADPTICDCGGSDFICLTDLTGNRTFLRHQGFDAQISTGSVKCEGSSWVALNDSDIQITRLEFIYPSVLPSAGQHPLTTMIMTAENNELSPKKKAVVDFQTAISSRIYTPVN